MEKHRSALFLTSATKMQNIPRCIQIIDSRMSCIDMIIEVNTEQAFIWS